MILQFKRPSTLFKFKEHAARLLPLGLALTTLAGCAQNLSPLDDTSLSSVDPQEPSANAPEASSRLEGHVLASTGGTSLVGVANVIGTSNDFDPDHGVAHLFDGCVDVTPECTTGSQTTESFTVDFDLKAAHSLTSARLFGDNEGTWVSSSWSLAYRNSPSEAWTTVVSHAGALSASWSERTLNIQARYVRLTVYGRSGTHKVQAREFQLLGSPSLPPFSPDAQGNFEFEAENFHRTVTGQNGHTWQLQSDSSSSGGQVMKVLPDNGTIYDGSFAGVSPHLDYAVGIPAAGTYYVWVRTMPNPSNVYQSDSVHIGLDSKEAASADKIAIDSRSLAWAKRTMDGGRASLSISNPGTHVINLFMREDGTIVDRILLTRDPNFVPSEEVRVPAPAPAPSEPPPRDEGVVFRVNFDKHAAGSQYSLDKIRSDFGNVGSVANPSLGVIVNGANAYSGNALRTAYPAGRIGGGTSLQFEARLPKVYDELYYSFRIRFDPKFNFVKGGKLTGICGGACNTGGEIPSGYDGWSARLMWTKNFGLERLVDQYVYHVGQPTKYGDDLYYTVNGQKSQFKPGQWYTIEWRVKMNTPGKSDGIIQSWIDGKPAVSKNLMYRMNNGFAIDKFIFSTFFGGGDSSWAPPSTQYIYWDDIVISTQPITH